MSRAMTFVAVLVVLIFVMGSCVGSSYNNFVNQYANVEKAIGNIEATTQRRLDLIPNLVEVVKGYAKHENSTLKDVIAARASATQVKLSMNDMTPEKMAQYQAAQGQLSTALGKLMVVSEQYPNLKADTQFSSLMAEIAGSENRIAEARKRYNMEVQRYNALILSFPNNIINSMFYHGTKIEMFKADEAAKKAPKVAM